MIEPNRQISAQNINADSPQKLISGSSQYNKPNFRVLTTVSAWICAKSPVLKPLKQRDIASFWT